MNGKSNINTKQIYLTIYSQRLFENGPLQVEFPIVAEEYKEQSSVGDLRVQVQIKLRISRLISSV